MKILELHSLTYSYDKNKLILKSVNAQMETGKMYAILGPSGCGKTTLLSLLGGLDSPASGSVLFEGKDIAQIGLARHRKNNVSFYFSELQSNRLSYSSGKCGFDFQATAATYSGTLGLTKEESKRNVLKLSGGQQQRVAIARALASEAPIILADEPTGNLDENTAQEITQILKMSAHEQEKCVVVVTHSNELAKQADVVLGLRNGKIQPLENYL